MLDSMSFWPFNRRHYIGSRVYLFPIVHRRSKYLIIFVIIKFVPTEWPEMSFKKLPSLDFVEYLEQKYAEKLLLRSGAESVAIDYLTNKVLTDAVGRAIYIREAMTCKDGIAGPRGGLPFEPSKENRLSLGRESPITVENRRRLQGAEAD